MGSKKGNKIIAKAKKLLEEDSYVKEQFRFLNNKISSLKLHLESLPATLKDERKVNKEVREVMKHMLKSIESPAPIKRKKISSKYDIRTDLDGVVDLVASREKISLSRISTELNVPLNIVEKWARILDKYGVVKLVYPKLPLLPPYLKIGKTYDEGRFT